MSCAGSSERFICTGISDKACFLLTLSNEQITQIVLQHRTWSTFSAGKFAKQTIFFMILVKQRFILQSHIICIPLTRGNEMNLFSSYNFFVLSDLHFSFIMISIYF